MIGGLYANFIIAAIFVGVTVGAYFTGDKNGATRVRAEFQALRLQEQAEHQAAINAAWQRKAHQEGVWQAKVSEIDKDRQRLRSANETQRLADLAALDARTLILRDPNRNAEASGNCAASVASGSSGSNGGAGAELPAKTAGFLLSLASEADAVVIQLSACQAILQSDRAIAK